MTAEEAVVQALARAMQFTDKAPSARSVLYRRLGVRQQQLYARAAALDADYAGICATGTLSSGALDLADLSPTVSAAESITKVTIEDKGTSSYAVGDDVNIVPSTDPDAGLAPRATIRDRVIRGVGTDLDGAVSLKVHYPKLPPALTATSKATALVMPEPHVELLVVDLALSMCRHVASTSEGAAQVAGGIELLSKEEEGLLAAWDEHVKNYAGGLTSRFGVPPREIPRG